MDVNQNGFAKSSKWNNIRNINKIEDDMSECFDERTFESIRKNKRKTLINKETVSYQLLEFIYQILRESDEIQISEEEIKFDVRGRFKSEITNMYFNETSLMDKEDLFILALHTETETASKQKAIAYGKNKVSKFLSSSKAKSQSEDIQEPAEPNSILGKLSEILDIDVRQQHEWTQKLRKKEGVVNVIVEEIQLHGKEYKASNTVFCKLGLAPGDDLKTNTMASIEGVTRTISEKKIDAQMVWGESVQLPFNKGECLCVEVWSNNYCQEKSKKKGDQDKKQNTCIATKIGQCQVQTGSQNLMTCKNHPLLSLSGKDVKGSITLEIEIIPSQGELRVLGYSEHQRYNLFKSLLQAAITYQISNYIPLSFCCLEQSIEEVCKRFSSEMGLTEFQVTTAHWAHVSKTAQFIESKRELEYSLILLNSKWENESVRLEEDEIEKLLESIKGFYNKHLEQLKFILTSYPPTKEEASYHVSEHLGVLLKLFRFLRDRNIFEDSDKFEFHIESNLRDGIYSWYSRTLEKEVNRGSFTSYLDSLNIFCQHIINFIRLLRKNYPSQSSIVKLDIPKLALTAIDPFLSGEIEQFLHQIAGNRGSVNDHLIFSIFILDRKIKLLLKEKEHFHSNNVKINFHLDVHGEWFKEFVNDWLAILKTASVENVNKAIEVESSIKAGFEDKNVTSSLIDIAFCLIPNYIFYSKMQEYQDIGIQLHVSYQVLLLIQETLENYVQKMGIKMRKLVGMQQETNFKMTDEICQILNNIHFAKEYLEEVPKKFETAPDSNLRALLGEAEECLQKKKSQILSEITPPFNSQFKKYFTVLLTSPADTPIMDAIADLMNWLLSIIKVCSVQLNQEIFNEFLQVLWMNIVLIIKHLVADKQTSSGKFDLISKSLNILFEFFYNDGEGLPHEMMEDSQYLSLNDQLQRLNMKSLELVLRSARVLADKREGAENRYGSLTYSTVYHPDNEILEITIMTLKDIPNPSFTGKFTPLIKVDTVPHSDKFEPVNTKPLKHSKNIFINEVLQFPIPLGDIDSSVVRISLVYTHSMGLRDQGYSGSIYIRGENIGRSSSDLRGFLAQQEKSTVGGLVEQNFAFPPNEENDYINILKERTDAVAQRYMQELNEALKKEVELNKYTAKVNRFSFFQRSK